MKRSICKVSGGKDSVAMWLWAIRTGLDPIAVYDDTRFEWEGHYAVLDALEVSIGPIIRIHSDKTFLEWCRHKGGFPSRVRKWCTEELKLKPCKLWLDHYRETTGEDVQLLLGIRHDESKRRADALEREWSDFYDCEVYRPILDWTVQDVIAEHHRAGVPMHPLYHEGAERVGCFPCVNAGKQELAMVARIQPSRIDEIREMEAEVGQTMFTRDRRAEKRKLGDDGPSVVPIGIDEVIAWAKTARGGRSLALFQPATGCARWGTCEAPVPEEVPKADSR
jgi:3'-phosphoadenosine 5'-phosphosulfate sulfotransferase (PAPS reductase)/FAD synthetase